MVARILIVEDDEPSRELAAFLLESAGYTVSTANNGIAGLRDALAGNPDLVISDVQMPGLDGYHLVRQLRSEPGWRVVPLIAVSAFSMRGDRGKAMAAGFDGYLSKPITPETFVQEISAFLPEDLRVGAPAPNV